MSLRRKQVVPYRRWNHWQPFFPLRKAQTLNKDSQINKNFRVHKRISPSVFRVLLNSLQACAIWVSHRVGCFKSLSTCLIGQPWKGHISSSCFWNTAIISVKVSTRKMQNIPSIGTSRSGEDRSISSCDQMLVLFRYCLVSSALKSSQLDLSLSSREWNLGLEWSWSAQRMTSGRGAFACSIFFTSSRTTGFAGTLFLPFSDVVIVWLLCASWEIPIVQPPRVPSLVTNIELVSQMNELTYRTNANLNLVTFVSNKVVL